MWKCVNCDSSEVEELDWVDMNSGEALSDDLDEYYCRTCKSRVEIYYEDETDNAFTDDDPDDESSKSGN